MQYIYILVGFQAGAWPIGQANLPTFAIPLELEKSVRMVCHLFPPHLILAKFYIPVPTYFLA